MKQKVAVVHGYVHCLHIMRLEMLEKTEDKALDVNLQLRFYSAIIPVKQLFSFPKAILDTAFLGHMTAAACQNVTRGHACHSLSVTHGTRFLSMLYLALLW